jgi:signal transduction histidine kinase
MSTDLNAIVRAWIRRAWLAPSLCAAVALVGITAACIGIEATMRATVAEAVWPILAARVAALPAGAAAPLPDAGALEDLRRTLQARLGDRGTVYVAVIDTSSLAELLAASGIGDALAAGSARAVALPRAVGAAPRSVVAAIHWRTCPLALGAATTGPLALALLGIVAALALAAHLTRRHLFAPVAAELAALGQRAVTARATQMLAHDVRKPLAVAKAVSTALQAESDPDAIRRLAAAAGLSLDRALATADGLIADVLEIGSRAALDLEPASPAALVETALHEALRGLPPKDVSFIYRLRHTQRMVVDPLKLTRVLVNVIANAVQATTEGGHVWVATRELTDAGRAWIELVIGNSDSHVPDADRERIFDAFYTSGKPGGTGLGLAIARKIVGAHGGTITCRSDTTVGVELVLRLPTLCGVLDRQPTSLPMSSADVYRALSPDAPAARPADDRRPRSCDDLRPLVAVVDDDPFLREAWCGGVADAVVVPFASPEAFWSWVAAPNADSERLALVVTDQHFGCASATTGVDLARALEDRLSVPVLLASDAPPGSLDLTGLRAVHVDKRPRPLATLLAQLKPA